MSCWEIWWIFFSLVEEEPGAGSWLRGLFWRAKEGKGYRLSHAESSDMCCQHIWGIQSASPKGNLLGSFKVRYWSLLFFFAEGCTWHENRRMEIVWEVLFLLQANFIVCISGTQLAQKGRGGARGRNTIQSSQASPQQGTGGTVKRKSKQ